MDMNNYCCNYFFAQNGFVQFCGAYNLTSYLHQPVKRRKRPIMFSSLQFHPQPNESFRRVAAQVIPDQLQLRFRVHIRMSVGFARQFFQRMYVTVVQQIHCRVSLQRVAARVTPCLKEYSIAACLNLRSCVILAMVSCAPFVYFTQLNNKLNRAKLTTFLQFRASPQGEVFCLVSGYLSFLSFLFRICDCVTNVL